MPMVIRTFASLLPFFIASSCSVGPDQNAETIGKSSAALTLPSIQRTINASCAAFIGTPGACNRCVVAVVRNLRKEGDITEHQSHQLIAQYSQGACHRDCGRDGTCACGSTCPLTPFPDATPCCPDATITCSYENSCGGFTEYHCKDGNWQVNACSPCCL
jgi:hypothetical protein